jgi:hypothetical protein
MNELEWMNDMIVPTLSSKNNWVIDVTGLTYDEKIRVQEIMIGLGWAWKHGHYDSVNARVTGSIHNFYYLSTPENTMRIKWNTIRLGGGKYDDFLYVHGNHLMSVYYDDF